MVLHSVKPNRFIRLLVTIFVAQTLLLFPKTAQAEGGFEDYEIRVIYPKFIQKRGRVEIGAQLTTVMNQVFIYTYMATGILNYHFTESLALELSGGYGFSLDKEDKRILEDEYEIQTQILRTQYSLNGGLLWTPVYGKYQLSSGRVVYFDTFVTLGGGLTGVEYLYEQCRTGDDDVNDENVVASKPPPTTKGYPGASIGIGQKFFISKSWGLRWDAKDNVFAYNAADGSCSPETTEGEQKLQNNITLQLGAMTFF